MEQCRLHLVPMIFAELPICRLIGSNVGEGANMRALKWIGIILFLCRCVDRLDPYRHVCLNETAEGEQDQKRFPRSSGRVRTTAENALDDKDVHLVAAWGILTTDSPIAKMPPDGGMPVIKSTLLCSSKAVLSQWASGRTRQRPNCWFGPPALLPILDMLLWPGWITSRPTP